jgi:L-asparaginase II
MKQEPAAIVEVVRGRQVESRHIVDIVIAEADGSFRAIYGDGDQPVFPRSAIKALQALAFVESGAADANGLGDRHIALACASHYGESIHVQAAREILSAVGLDETRLECGAQWPFHDTDRDALIIGGRQPGAIHNNCSGKHAGFLAFAIRSGFSPEGYVAIDHPVQRAIAAHLEAATGARHAEVNCGIDGCSIPTYAIPLRMLALAYARFGVGQNASDSRGKAMLRIRDACFRHPEMIAGAGGFDSDLMRLLRNRAFTKTGAEGVFAVSLPEQGVGIALKCRDGATRAAEVAVATTVEHVLKLDGTGVDAMTRFTNPALLNRRGGVVGEIRVA